ncbi:MAG: hypothetical protein OEY38_21605 [Gammaproteobacteria bacterium]|nr:hypothetical protein [Gammaproteobacteria bacterium]
MQKELEKLVSQLCTEWGFCISPEEAKKIIETKNIKADQFACAILEAEGMNSELEIEWRRKIKNKFIEAIGSDIS